MATTDCLRRLAQAAGRELSESEVRGIFERVHKAALDIKAGRISPEDVRLGKKLQDDLGVGVSEDKIIQMAAERAAKDLIAESAEAERRANLQILATGKGVDAYKRLREVDIPPLQAIDMLIFNNYKGRSSIESLEQHVRGVKSELVRKLQPTWDALGQDWLGLFQDEAKQVELLRAMRGEKAESPIANRGAETWRETAEGARRWFNEAGGHIGEREDWGTPQHHSQIKAAQAASVVHGIHSDDIAVNQKAWVDRKMDRIDPAKYKDLFGIQLSEGEIRGVLGKIWETISTNGVNDITPGKQVGLSRANRHAEHRAIHYKDAQSMLDDWKEFGDKSFLEIIYGHIDKMARDIAILEKMGPDDRMTWKSLLDMARKEAVLANRSKEQKITAKANRLDDYYNHSTGRVKPTANAAFSGFMDGLAHLNSAAKGGGFALASLFGDRAMYQAVAHMNNLPVFQDWGKQLSLLSPSKGAERRMLQRNGLMLEQVISGLNRFWGDFGTSSSFAGTTSKMANAVMKLTGMTSINEIPKAAFGAGLFHAIGKELDKSFDKLHASDVRTLRNYGITEADWNVWKLATRDENGLTPEAIGHISEEQLKAAGFTLTDQRNAVVKLLGAVNTEADFAIVTPGWKERAQFYSGLQRGTAFGEISRAVLQFKAFPWAFLRRGMDAFENMDGVMPKAAMAAYLIVSTTLAGAMLMQTRDVLSGKDPRKMLDDNALKFWGAAFLQGGALGIYGDFLYGAGHTRYGSGILESMAGPTVGPLLELGAVQPITAITQKAEGKETHFAAQELQDIKGFVPGQNLWPLKAALDHFIWNQALDAVSPGYIQSMRERTQKEFKQKWWWRPGDAVPERAPDVAGAVER